MYTIGEIEAIRTVKYAKEADEWPIAVHVTIIPKELKPELLIQGDLYKVGAIIRGKRVPNGPFKDREHDYYEADGLAIVGALDRSRVWTWYDLVDDYESRRRDMKSARRVALFTSNGNLGANRAFACWFSQTQDRQKMGLPSGLFSAPEFDLGDWHDSLVVWRDGHVSIDRLRYENGNTTQQGYQTNARVREAVGTNEDIEDRIVWATSGQQLVRNGQAAAYAEIAQMVNEGLFYDLNHAFLFPWFRVEDAKCFVQIGYRTLLQGDNLSRALSGAAVEVDISSRVWEEQCRYSDRTTFVRDLSDKLAAIGYQNTTGAGALLLGEYRIDGDVLEICFLPGIYTHNLLGVSKAGSVVLIQVAYPRGGKMTGNRSAMTLVGTAQAAFAAANRALAQVNKGDCLWDCLLMDNGGDVRLLARLDEYSWEPRVRPEFPRQELRSIIAFVSDADHVTLPLPATSTWSVEELLGARWQPLPGGGTALVCK